MLRKLKLIDVVDLHYVLNTMISPNKDEPEKKFHGKFLYAVIDKNLPNLSKLITGRSDFISLCNWLRGHKVSEKKEDENKIEDKRAEVSQEEWDKKQAEYDKMVHSEVEVDVYYCSVEYLPQISRDAYILFKRTGFINVEELDEK